MENRAEVRESLLIASAQASVVSHIASSSPWLSASKLLRAWTQTPACFPSTALISKCCSSAPHASRWPRQNYQRRASCCAEPQRTTRNSSGVSSAPPYFLLPHRTCCPFAARHFFASRRLETGHRRGTRASEVLQRLFFHLKKSLDIATKSTYTSPPKPRLGMASGGLFLIGRPSRRRRMLRPCRRRVCLRAEDPHERIVKRRGDNVVNDLGSLVVAGVVANDDEAFFSSLWNVFPLFLEFKRERRCSSVRPRPRPDEQRLCALLRLKLVPSFGGNWDWRGHFSNHEATRIGQF